MREITFEQGITKGIMRIMGKDIFLKINNPQNLAQVISQYEAKGAKITHGLGWIKVDIFNQDKDVTIGNNTFNVNEKTPEEIEKILADFFLIQYAKANFKVKETPQPID